MRWIRIGKRARDSPSGSFLSDWIIPFVRNGKGLNWESLERKIEAVKNIESQFCEIKPERKWSP